MRYFSTFSGIGGFELGIQQAYKTNLSLRNGTPSFTEAKTIQQGMESAPESYESRRTIPDNTSTGIAGEILDSRPVCIGYSEIDKYAIQIYQKHFNHKNYGDITKISASTLPDFDLFVGGFPCQAFSIAGKRGGFDDTRGTLFFDIARILKEKQPRNFLLENVKGLLSHNEGRTFKTIITTLVELGYCVEWQVLNSKNFGVPQNRERVFIVGHLGGIPRRKVFPIREADGTFNQGFDQGDTQVEITQTLRSRYGNGSGSHIVQLNQPQHSNDRIYDIEGLSPTLNTMQGGNRQPFVNVGRIRRLTPTECERLQGYPDGWTEGVSDTQRYKTLGNSVTVNVIEEIIKIL